jgi:hypothetical protein
VFAFQVLFLVFVCLLACLQWLSYHSTDNYYYSIISTVPIPFSHHDSFVATAVGPINVGVLMDRYLSFILNQLFNFDQSRKFNVVGL